MAIVILIVTWIVAQEPPSSFQTTFNSIEACQKAQAAILIDGNKLKAEKAQ
jgi:hypothetical protein